MMELPSDFLDNIEPADMEKLPDLELRNQQTLGAQIPNKVKILLDDLFFDARSESNATVQTEQTRAGDWTHSRPSLHDVATLLSPIPSQAIPESVDLDTAPYWAQQNQKQLYRALGLDRNKPGPRAGEKGGENFAKELKAARGCPLRMATVRGKSRNRHLFEGICKRGMEQRMVMAFLGLLAATDPALVARDPLVSLDVHFARRYYDIDLVALATPP